MGLDKHEVCMFGIQLGQREMNIFPVVFFRMFFDGANFLFIYIAFFGPAVTPIEVDVSTLRKQVNVE